MKRKRNTRIKPIRIEPDMKKKWRPLGRKLPRPPLKRPRIRLMEALLKSH